MAESAAAYLNANPGRRMVILAGSGHLEFGSGIPKRLERRTKATYAIVLNGGDQVEPHMADYLLLSKKQELPAAGILGVSLEEKDGECRIGSLSPGGAGEKADLKAGDVLVAMMVKRSKESLTCTWPFGIKNRETTCGSACAGSAAFEGRQNVTSRSSWRRRAKPPGKS